jgi:hypothetical protein
MKVKIKNKAEDLAIKYLFIKKWSYTNFIIKENYQGHPFEGRVYRSIYNTKTKSYSLVLFEDSVHNMDDSSGLIVEDINSDNEENGYLSEVKIISKSNLLELQLDEEDLDKIINWQETNNSDLFTEMNPIPQEILVRLEQALTAPSGDQHLMDEALHTASELINVNYDFFDVWIELGQLLVEQSIADHDSQAVVLSESEGGMSLNIGDVYKALKVYTSDDRKTNLDRSSVHEAMIGLARELVRRNLNELD